jgi:hypothetical protein
MCKHSLEGCSNFFNLQYFLSFFDLVFFLSFACQDVKNLFVVAGAKVTPYTLLAFFDLLLTFLTLVLTDCKSLLKAIFFPLPPSSYREEGNFMDVVYGVSI